MKKNLPLILSLAALVTLASTSASVAAGARRGLDVCARSLVPSLFPFFVLSNLLSELRLPDLLSDLCGGAMRKLFRVTGAGAQAFILGITGGYPLGASVTAGLRRDGLISRKQAERLLAFCNNSGPAFILGAVGGILHDPAAGLILYAAHVLAALCVGLIMRGDEERDPAAPTAPQRREAPAFSAALSAAVPRAISSVLSVSGYVVLFSALLAIVPLPDALPPLPRALITGFFELGGGVATLSGLGASPPVLAAAAFLLGWGGVSVHCQTLAAVAGTDIKCARHLAGRALCGVFAAVFTYLLSVLLLQ